MKTLLKSFIIYGFSAAVGKFFGLILTPVYTRIFSPADYGMIDILTAFSYVLTIAAAFEIWNGIARDYPEAADLQARTSLISTGFWYIVTGSVVIVAIGLLLFHPVNDLLFQSRCSSRTFAFVIGTIPLSALNTYGNILIRFEQKPWVLFIAMGLQVLLNVAVSLTLILVFGFGVEGYFIGLAVSTAAAVSLMLWHLRGYIRFRFDRGMMRSALSFSIPLIPAVLGIWLNTYAGRFIMLKYLSLDDVGIYVIGLKLSSVFLFVEYAFRLAWTPYLYELIQHQEYQARLVRIYRALLHGVTAAMVVVVLFAREFIQLMTTPQYYGAISVAGLLCIPAVLQIFNQIVNVGSVVTRKTVYDTIAYLTGMSLNILSMIVLIPLLGLMGVAVALTIGSLCTFFLFIYFSKSLCGIRFPLVRTATLIAVWVAVSVASSTIPLPVVWKVVVSATGSGVLGIILYRYYVRTGGGLFGIVMSMVTKRMEREG